MRITLPIIILLIIVGTAFTYSVEIDPEPVEKEKVEVLFTTEMDFNDLVEIKLEMANKGISLMYQQLMFGDNGQLQGIQFKVDCNDGFSGSATSIPLQSDKPIGFMRNYDPDAISPFGTGSMEKKSEN